MATQRIPTITELCIAAGIGFGHLGRFAAYYDGLFGEAPSQTLRKAERSAV